MVTWQVISPRWRWSHVQLRLARATELLREATFSSATHEKDGREPSPSPGDIDVGVDIVVRIARFPRSIRADFFRAFDAALALYDRRRSSGREGEREAEEGKELFARGIRDLTFEVCNDLENIPFDSEA